MRSFPWAHNQEAAEMGFEPGPFGSKPCQYCSKFTSVGCSGFSELQTVFSGGLWTSRGHLFSYGLNVKGLTGCCV